MGIYFPDPQALISFAEFQVPAAVAPRALVSFAELQVPDPFSVGPPAPPIDLSRQPLGSTHFGDWRDLQPYTWAQLQAYTWGQLAGAGGAFKWSASSRSTSWETN